MSVIDNVRAIVEPLISAHAPVEIYDIEYESGILRIMVDTPDGINVDTIGELAQEISEALDENDPFPDSRYLLEVTSPGIERKLRTPAHFQAQIGEDINLKTKPDVQGPRRLNAKLVNADELGIDVEGREAPVSPWRLGYDQIEAARTIFHWGEQTTSPGKSKKSKQDPEDQVLEDLEDQEPETEEEASAL